MKGVVKLKTEVVSQEKNVIVFKAEIDTEQVNSAIEKTYKNLSMRSNIKGFRKGHVPRKAIDLYFSKKDIYAEAMENIIPDVIEKIVEDYDLKLIAEPNIKPSGIEAGKPLNIEVTFEVTPEVVLPELESVEAEKTIYVPTEKMLEDNIMRLLDTHSELVPTYEEREITKDDYVSVKYSSSIIEKDGSIKTVEDGEKTEIDLGHEDMRPELREAIVGKRPGDTAVAEFLVEDDMENKEIAGKKMRYDIEILGIMNRKVPDLTDETVTEITQSRHKTVDEFKAAIMEQLNAAAERESNESLKNSAVSKICDLAEVEIPESLIKSQKDSIRALQAERIKRESGLTFDEFLEKSGMDKDSYETELDTAARQIVKRSLVLEAIAEANDIEWTQDELNAEIQRIAITSRIDPKRFRDYVYNDRERLFEIAEKIRNRKTMDFIITKVKFAEVAEKDQEETAEKAAD